LARARRPGMHFAVVAPDFTSVNPGTLPTPEPLTTYSRTGEAIGGSS
jgi:hypothetical protein